MWRKSIGAGLVGMAILCGCGDDEPSGAVVQVCACPDGSEVYRCHGTPIGGCQVTEERCDPDNFDTVDCPFPE